MMHSENNLCGRGHDGNFKYRRQLYFKRISISWNSTIDKICFIWSFTMGFFLGCNSVQLPLVWTVSYSMKSWSDYICFIIDQKTLGGENLTTWKYGRHLQKHRAQWQKFQWNTRCTAKNRRKTYWCKRVSGAQKMLRQKCENKLVL